jgi:aspartyl-tRNA(Asn)/glutamyl-tRNA(Gln) amidotransferase subunit C
MKIARADVERVALLARLRLTENETVQLTAQLDAILTYMDKLNEIDTTHVEPFSLAVDRTQVYREDQATNKPNPEALLANAPERDNSFFKVPKILE